MSFRDMQEKCELLSDVLTHKKVSNKVQDGNF